MSFFKPGMPALVTETVPNPAAGANFLFVLPANSRNRIIGVNYTLTTDATAAGRVPNLRIVIDNTIFRFESSIAVTASTVQSLSWWSGLGAIVNAGTLDIAHPLPGDIQTDKQDPISCNILNLQPGDQLTSIFITMQRWIQPD